MKKTTGSVQAPPATGPLLWFALVGIGIAWGSTQVFSKIIVNEGHHPFGISLVTISLGVMMITAFLVARGVKLPFGRRHLVYYAICGLLGTALPNYTAYTSIRELPVGIVSIILAAVPLKTFLIAMMFRVERPEPRRLVGLLAGAGAVVLLVGPEASLPRAGDTLWVGVALITGLSYAIENVYIAKARPEDCGALQTLCGLSWMAFLMILPVTALTGTWMDMSDFGAAHYSAAAIAVLHLVAYGGFVWLIGRAGPVFAAQVGYVVTLSGVALGIAVFDEAHSGWVWSALALMLAGLALVQPRPSR
ncbi:MAG: DMT family transporter [Pseudomonadota bacterium]